MPNRNYINGAARERRLLHQLEEKGYIVIRSAGSHSQIDLIAIHKYKKKILFLQVKPKSMSKNAKDKIEKELSWLNEEFVGNIFCITNLKEIEEAL